MPEGPPPADRPPSSSESWELFDSGELLGGVYRIERLIGRGAMGQVFEAEDLPLRRTVAIKALHQQREGVRLQEEAHALAQLSDPGIAAVYSFGQHLGIDYLVMERIRGADLESHLRRLRKEGTQLTVEEVIDVLQPLASTLAAVHRAGIAHCDVKPSNLMLAPGGRVVLMDFGIFVAEQHTAGAAAFRGTPEYMAPELITAGVQPGDAHRVDLYALGVLGYELLTGVNPFGGGKTADIWRRHLNTPPPDLGALRTDAPAWLRALIADLLAKAPEDRPQVADEVAWRLRDGRALQARPRKEPVAETAAKEAAAKEQSRRLSPASGPAPVEPFSVLIAEDDPDAAKLLAAAVRKAAPGAELRIAPDGLAALRLIRLKVPHLLLLDLAMPHLGGIDLCVLLRGTHLADRCKLVAVSNQASDADLRLLQQMGHTQFILKGARLFDAIEALARETMRLSWRGP